MWRKFERFSTLKKSIVEESSAWCRSTNNNTKIITKIRTSPQNVIDHHLVRWKWIAFGGQVRSADASFTTNCGIAGHCVWPISCIYPICVLHRTHYPTSWFYTHFSHSAVCVIAISTFWWNMGGLFCLSACYFSVVHNFSVYSFRFPLIVGADVCVRLVLLS